MSSADEVDGLQNLEDTAQDEQAAADLDCALHDLAQPLTALAFLTEMAAMQSDTATWRVALEASVVETRRAMEKLRQAREAAARLMGRVL
jgi:hypothetical protein